MMRGSHDIEFAQRALSPSLSVHFTLSTRPYVAQAYVEVFAYTPIDQLAGRVIGLSELQASGQEIATALTRKHSGSPPDIRREPLHAIEGSIENGAPGALALYCRKIWGEGRQPGMIGSDVYTVRGRRKSTLEELVVEGKVDDYRIMPQQRELLEALFRGVGKGK
jgi:hypothetical protein